MDEVPQFTELASDLDPNYHKNQRIGREITIKRISNGYYIDLREGTVCDVGGDHMFCAKHKEYYTDDSGLKEIRG